MGVTHSTVATAPDDPDAEVNAAEWNDDHVVADGSLVAAKLSASATDVVFGRSSAGPGKGQEIAVTAAGRALIDDADAAAQRTTLGIATAITGTKIDDLTAGDDNTDLNATTGHHGLLPKLDNNSAHFLNGQGGWTTPAGGSGFIGFVVLKEIQSANTQAGAFTSGAWRTRTLNTEELDTNGDCTLSSNQFTLAAGTYDIEASAPAVFVSGHQIRLYNVTDSATILPGTSDYAPNVSGADGSQTRSYVIGRFTIAASKALEIQHRCTVTRNTNGFGVAANFGENEVYAVVRLWRVS